MEAHSRGMQASQAKGKKRSFDEGIKDFINCPVCTEDFDSTVFQCSNGHALCENCHGQIMAQAPQRRTCPMCNQKLGNIRNLLVEQMIRQRFLPCKYSCGAAEMQCEARKKHEEQCPARPFACPFCDCNTEITPGSALTHLKEQHGKTPKDIRFPVKLTDAADLSTQSIQWCIVIKGESNQNVVLVVEWKQGGSCMFFLLSLDMPVVPRPTYQISFTSKGRTFSFTGPLRHARERGAVKKTGDCLVIQPSMLIFMAGAESDIVNFNLDVSIKLPA